ncbi:MAG: ammonium transporter [Adhaeribacter sp.]|nr:ammonium transporter [Adhaeribacter sp.]
MVEFYFLGSIILLKVTDLISPLSVSREEEELGLDLSQHEEQVSFGNGLTEVHKMPEIKVLA